MNRLSTQDRAQIVAALVEGMSIRAICRMQGVGKNTVARLIADLGHACACYSDGLNRGIADANVQCDEIWTFIGAKDKNVRKPEPDEDLTEAQYRGSVWTWTAIESTTKLMVTWTVGKRDSLTADRFLRDLAGRLVGRPQVNSDKLNAYRFGVRGAFRGNVDHGMVHKVYGHNPNAPEARYSPGECIGCGKEAVTGSPNMETVSTSYVERSNLTVRMGLRRYTRLTNGFSKKLEQHCAMVAIFFTYYNLCRKHETLGGRTPAQAAGLADHRWTVEELVGLLERLEAQESA